MLFSNDGRKDKAKKQSLLGELFNPRIGDEIRSLRQETSTFVRMIAALFVMNGLFPKDHPGLNNLDVRLTLADVFVIAWQRLKLTREGIPQIVLFAAVTGTIVFTVLTFVTFVFSLLVGQAHAQGGLFDPPNPNTDWGRNMLNYMFLGTPVATSEGAGALDCSMHTALSQALSFFSTAVLVLAGIILFYHLASMVAKTAQTGQPFAGANQLWAPIRLVFAVALLVPIAAAGGAAAIPDACPVAGYNTGQYLAFQLAQWGSGLASRAWTNFATAMDAFSSGANCTTLAGGEPVAGGSRTTLPPSCPGGQQNLRTFVATLTIADACAMYANYYLAEGGSVGYEVYDLASVPRRLNSGIHRFGYEVNNGTGDDIINGGMLDEYESDLNKPRTVCGGYEIHDEPSASNPFRTIHQAMYAPGGPVDTLMRSVHEFNNIYYMRAIAGNNFGYAAGGGARDPGTSPEEMVTAYNMILTNFELATDLAIDTAITGAALAGDGTILANYTAMRDGGWVFAGAMFNMIARLQGQKFEALRNALPLSVWPDLLRTANGVEPVLEGVEASTRTATRTYGRAIGTVMETISDRETIAGGTGSEEATAAAAEASSLSMGDLLKADDPMNLIADKLVAVGTRQGLWDFNGTLGIRFGMTENPITEIAAFGHKNIGMGVFALTMAGLAAMAGSSVVFGASIATLATFASGLLTFLATTFFTIGFSLGYVVPLYAFYRFFFGVVKWLMTVLEAIVLVPLFALAHVHPAGDGLPGPKAAYGYSVAMQLLLRPILMVFGLIVGFLLFKVFTVLLGPLFAMAAIGTGNLSGWASLIGKLIYTIVYAALVIVLANQCFKPIGLFPAVALRWFGAGGIHEENVGDPQMLAGAGMWLASKGFGDLSSRLTGLPGAYRANKATELGNQKEAAASRQAVVDRNATEDYRKAMGTRSDFEAGNAALYRSRMLGALERGGDTGERTTNPPTSGEGPTQQSAPTQQTGGPASSSSTAYQKKEGSSVYTRDPIKPEGGNMDTAQQPSDVLPNRGSYKIGDDGKIKPPEEE